MLDENIVKLNLLINNEEFTYGTIRANCINKFIKSKEVKELTNVAKNYLKEVLFEKLSGMQRHSLMDLSVSNDQNSNVWGRNNENVAIEYYEKINNVKVIKPKHKIVDIVAGRCDGEIIGGEGLIEVKCPYNPIIHLDNLKKNKVSYSENTQIQVYLWLYDKKYCDYVSFDPRLPEKYRMKIIRVERDNEFISKIKASIELAKDYMNSEFIAINNYL